MVSSLGAFQSKRSLWPWRFVFFWRFVLVWFAFLHCILRRFFEGEARFFGHNVVLLGDFSGS